MPTTADLGAKIKAKYPGAYDDVPDADLGAKMKAKFPGAYDDFVEGWSPPDPAQMDALLGQRQADDRRAKLGPVRPVAPRGGPADALSLVASGASFNVLPNAAAALVATIPALSPDAAGTSPEWEGRFRQARGIFRGIRDAQRAGLPNAAPTLETAGALATGFGAGAALAPASTLAASGPLAARLVAAGADAALVNGLARGAERTGAPGASLAGGFSEGAQEGAHDPWNALAPAFVGAAEPTGPLVRSIRNAAASKAVAAADPRKAGVTALREGFAQGRYGPYGIHNAGDILLELQLPDGTPVIQPGDTPALIAEKIKVLKARAMEGKGEVVQRLTKDGVVVDAGGLLGDLEQIFNAEMNTRAAMVPAENEAPRSALRRTLDNFRKQFGPGRVEATSTNIQYPAQQLDLPFSKMERPEPVGTVRGPDTNIPAGEPVQIGLGLPGLDDARPTGFYERAPEQTTLLRDEGGAAMVSQRGATGASAANSTRDARLAAATGGEPRNSPGYLLGRGNMPERFEGSGLPDVVRKGAKGQPDKVIPQSTRRPVSDTGHYAVTETTQGPVTSEELGRQVEMFSGYDVPPAPTAAETVPGDPMATELARQLRSGHTEALPPRDPVTPDSTNIRFVNDIPLDQAEALKTELGNVVHRTKSAYGKDRAAIQADPLVRTTDRFRARVRQTDREVVDAAGLEQGAEFRQANSDASQLADLEALATTGADPAEAAALSDADTLRNLVYTLRHYGWALPGAMLGHSANPVWGTLAGGAAGLAAPHLMPGQATQARGLARGADFVEAVSGKLKLDPGVLNALLAEDPNAVNPKDSLLEWLRRK